MAKPALIFIDDEKDILDVYKELLSDLPYEIHYFENAADALDLLKQQKIDLIICDDHMKEMNGIEFLKIYREIELNQECVFYLITGQCQLKDDEYYNLGCKRIIQKPFELEEIIAMINMDLKNHKI